MKLQIWDTAGQEKFRTITGSYYRGAYGIIIVYDITSEESFNHVPHWNKEIDKYAQDVPVVRLLVGNKCDLADERKISVDRGRGLAKSLDIEHLETSAKTAANVEKAFNMLAEKIYNSLKAKEHTDPPDGTLNLHTVSGTPPHNKECKC